MTKEASERTSAVGLEEKTLKELTDLIPRVQIDLEDASGEAREERKQAWNDLLELREKIKIELASGDKGLSPEEAGEKTARIEDTLFTEDGRKGRDVVFELGMRVLEEELTAKIGEMASILETGYEKGAGGEVLRGIRGIESYIRQQADALGIEKEREEKWVRNFREEMGVRRIEELEEAVEGEEGAAEGAEEVAGVINRLTEGAKFEEIGDLGSDVFKEVWQILLKNPNLIKDHLTDENYLLWLQRARGEELLDDEGLKAFLEEYGKNLKDFVGKPKEEGGITEDEYNERLKEANEVREKLEGKEGEEEEEAVRPVVREIPEVEKRGIAGVVARVILKYINNLDPRGKDKYWRYGALSGGALGAIAYLFPALQVPILGNAWKTGVSMAVTGALWGGQRLYFGRKEAGLEKDYSGEELAVKVELLRTQHKVANEHIAHFLAGMHAGTTYAMIGSVGWEIVGDKVTDSLSGAWGGLSERIGLGAGPKTAETIAELQGQIASLESQLGHIQADAKTVEEARSTCEQALQSSREEIAGIQAQLSEARAKEIATRRVMEQTERIRERMEIEEMRRATGGLLDSSRAVAGTVKKVIIEQWNADRPAVIDTFSEAVKDLHPEMDPYGSAFTETFLANEKMFTGLGGEQGEAANKLLNHILELEREGKVFQPRGAGEWYAVAMKATGIVKKGAEIAASK